MVIQVGSDPSIQPVPTLNAYLRRKFDNENIRVVTRPKKTDSLEVYIGEEFLGVLFLEVEKGRKSYIFELPILDVDLVDFRHLAVDCIRRLLADCDQAVCRCRLATPFQSLSQSRGKRNVMSALPMRRSSRQVPELVTPLREQRARKCSGAA